MADTTIDIIYRFLADTREFDKELKKSNSNAGNIKLPDAKELEANLRGVSKEINRLVKVGKLTEDQAAALKVQYKAAKSELKQMADILAKMKASTPVAPPVAAPTAPSLSNAAKAGSFWDTDRTYKDSILFQKAFEKTFTSTKKGVIDMRTGIKATAESLRDFRKMSRDELAAIANQVREKPIRSFRELGAEITKAVKDFRGFARVGQSLTQIGSTLAISGGIITGGIFKAASDYIKKQGDLGKANAVTRDWAKEMGKIEVSSGRIGKVLASQAIPLLSQGASLLGKLASFLEKHPEAAGIALKAGLVLTAVGSLIALAGKGITIAVDIAFLAAADEIAAGGSEVVIGAGIMEKAADKILAGAGIMNKGAITNGVPTVVKGGIGLALTEAVVALGAFTGGLVIGDKIFDNLFKHDQKFADYITTFKQTLALDAKGIGDIFAGKQLKVLGQPVGPKISDDLGDDWFKKVRDALFKVKDASDEAGNSLEGISDLLANSLKRDEVLKAYEDYKADDLALVAKHYEDRKKIIQDALSAELKENERFAADIRKAYAKEASQLAAAATAFNRQNDKDEAKNKEDRAKIIQDSGKDILKMEADLQEKLRKLHDDYAEREVDLLAARDAVGLTKNRAKYLKDANELQRGTNEEIAQRRADLREKLQDLQASYEAERAQRLEDYNTKVKEIQANAKEELDQIRQKHIDEMREIVLNRNARLKELDTQFQAERKRRQDAFIAQVRDLDATLLGEETLRKQHQDAMLKELDLFLSRYRSGLSTLVNAVATSGSRQVGGYVNSGLYKLHDGEYVLNPSTTRMLESMMGGQLTQAGVMQMAHSNTNRSQITWNDSRRFNSRLQAEDRRQINQDTVGLLDSMVKGI